MSKEDSAECLTDASEYKKMLQEADQCDKEWPELPVPLSPIVGLSNVSALLKKLGSVPSSTTPKIDLSEYVSVPQKHAWADISILEAPKVQCPTPTTRTASGSRGPILASFEQLQNDEVTTTQFLRSLDLEPPLMECLANQCYILSDIVQKGLKMLISDPTMNLILQSPKYTGKDTARHIYMLHRVEATKMYPQVLCLFPTKDLGFKMDVQLLSQCSFDVKIKLANPQHPVDPDKKLTQQILLGTPSDVIKLGLEFNVFDLNKISLFMVSKADKLISTLEDQNETLKIYENLNPSCQVAFFSETYEQECMDYVEYIVENPVILKERFQ